MLCRRLILWHHCWIGRLRKSSKIFGCSLFSCYFATYLRTLAFSRSFRIRLHRLKLRIIHRNSHIHMLVVILCGKHCSEEIQFVLRSACSTLDIHAACEVAENRNVGKLEYRLSTTQWIWVTWCALRQMVSNRFVYVP